MAIMVSGTTAKRKQIRKLKFCLAEAVRLRTHGALRQSAALTLHSDESKEHLILRGQLCGEDLCPQHLLLSTVNLVSRFESSGVGIASGVVTCLRQLATPLLGAPFTADDNPAAAPHVPHCGGVQCGRGVL